MPEPTEAGWYWVRIHADGKWRPVQVHEQIRNLQTMEKDFACCPWPVGTVCKVEWPEFEWGERIPDNDTLKARRELAGCDPTEVHSGECIGLLEIMRGVPERFIECYQRPPYQGEQDA